MNYRFKKPQVLSLKKIQKIERFGADIGSIQHYHFYADEEKLFEITVDEYGARKIIKRSKECDLVILDGREEREKRKANQALQTTSASAHRVDSAMAK